MQPSIQFYGATGEVTGSCHLVTCGSQRLLLDCGLIQGNRKQEARNRDPFPFEPSSIDAVVLSHAHLDHSGRLPLLVKSGFRGKIYTQRATAELCEIMLRDSASLMQRDARIETRKRQRKGLEQVEPTYTIEDAEAVFPHFSTVEYGQRQTILPGIELQMNDAGHILGSAISEIWLEHDGETRKLVFSGDLGRSGMPVLQDPVEISEADMVVMESTYGDRLHRSWDETSDELRDMFKHAINNSRGNILIPAFAVGRTQEILYLFAKYYEEWELGRWKIFLDSPMAIEATDVYTRNSNLFDKEAIALWREHKKISSLPNLHFTRKPDESMKLNQIRSGAIIIAGSGMCTGGRIKHHFKHNIWRRETHVLITGFQARGTPGRMLVDGATKMRLWGETVQVKAAIHTVGGLSAHADQAGLIHWYNHFRQRPALVLVHGETDAQKLLQEKLSAELMVNAKIAAYGDIWPI